MTDESRQLDSDLNAARRADLQDKAETELVHTGSQNIPGYRPQTEEAKNLVVAVKEMERNFAAWLQQVYFGASVPVDARQVASARTHLEYAFYHLNRAVFQPADPIGDVVKAGPGQRR